jgi:hypothetical protein
MRFPFCLRVGDLDRLEFPLWEPFRAIPVDDLGLQPMDEDYLELLGVRHYRAGEPLVVEQLKESREAL